jgi:hypothetical protein
MRTPAVFLYRRVMPEAADVQYIEAAFLERFGLVLKIEPAAPEWAKHPGLFLDRRMCAGRVRKPEAEACIVAAITHLQIKRGAGHTVKNP